MLSSSALALHAFFRAVSLSFIFCSLETFAPETHFIFRVPCLPFSALFNLQCANLSSPRCPQAFALGRSAYLSYHTLSALSRTFFRNFFGFQPLFPFHSSIACAAYLFYQVSARLSSAFFILFSRTFSAPDRPSTFQNRRPFPDSFVSITHSPTFVNTFFPLFRPFSSRA